MLPTSLAGLTEFYDIRKGALERIAGRDAQVVVLEPRDAWRYGHKFWVDTDSGLLLKAGMLDERNGTAGRPSPLPSCRSVVRSIAKV